MNFSDIKKDKMATGNISLLIPCNLTKSTFEKKAQLFKERANANVLFKIDTGESPMWVLLIKWRPFILVLDERNNGLALESTMKWCNSVAEDLIKELPIRKDQTQTA